MLMNIETFVISMSIWKVCDLNEHLKSDLDEHLKSLWSQLAYEKWSQSLDKHLKSDLH